jgi:hypothetical protein
MNWINGFCFIVCFLRDVFPLVTKFRNCKTDVTSLNLDLFGLGPAEIVVIAVAATVLYG